MKIGAVDMGTNSCRLLIVDYSQGNYQVLEKGLITTRLGQGVDNNKLLSETAIKRALTAIKKFKSTLNYYQVQKVIIIGTSALREVNNATELKKLIKQETDYNLEIISGRQEANLIYRGASLDFLEENYLIIDIGGGSTEFIWKQDKDVNFKSLNMGAVRMTERYIKDSEMPLAANDYDAIYRDVSGLLDNTLAEVINNQQTAVGVGGTITTLAAMDLKLDNYDSDIIHGYKLTYRQIIKLLHRVSAVNMKKRKRINGLQPERADIIIAGIIILKEIMDYFKLNNITVSEHGILYGMIRDFTDGLLQN